MIQTTQEKHGDHKGMWMGALGIARWQLQETAKMKSELRSAWVRGGVFNYNILGTTGLGRGEDRRGHVLPANISSKDCDKGGSKSR